MATVINNPGTDSSSGAGWGVAVVLVVLVVLALMFGIPALRGATSGTSVTVPDKIDVNVSGGGGAAEGQ